jgi:hypothetical protein
MGFVATVTFFGATAATTAFASTTATFPFFFVFMVPPSKWKNSDH